MKKFYNLESRIIVVNNEILTYVYLIWPILLPSEVIQEPQMIATISLHLGPDFSSPICADKVPPCPLLYLASSVCPRAFDVPEVSEYTVASNMVRNHLLSIIRYEVSKRMETPPDTPTR